jgi:hypothetical protein
MLATLFLAVQPSACRGRDQSAAVTEAFSYLTDPRAGMLTPATPKASCRNVFREGIAGAALTSLCVLREADSLTYSYTSDRGEVLVRGRSIHVDAIHLKPFADSLESAISLQFGEGVNCLQSATRWAYTKTFRYWRGGGSTFFLRTTILNEPRLYPAVELESAKGDRKCDMFIGSPANR